MTVMIKTMQVADLPPGWQVELGLAKDGFVRVEVREVGSSIDPVVQARLLRQLLELKPVKIGIDSTNFIRIERDRMDGRNP